MDEHDESMCTAPATRESERRFPAAAFWIPAVLLVTAGSGSGFFDPGPLALLGPPLLAAQEPTEPESRAERLTVSFQNAPIREVLRTFAEVSGRSIVVGPEAAGIRVTAEIRDQPWELALEAILTAYGLRAREGESGILLVSRRAAATETPEEPTLVTRIFRIRYARADEIAAAIQPHLSPDRGRVSVLPSLNAVLVTDVPEEVERMARLIRGP